MKPGGAAGSRWRAAGVHGGGLGLWQGCLGHGRGAGARQAGCYGPAAAWERVVMGEKKPARGGLYGAAVGVATRRARLPARRA